MTHFTRLSLTSVLIMLVLGGAIYAGGSGEEEADGEISIQLGISPREVGAVIPDLLSDFEAANPGVTVEWLEVPGVPNEQKNLYVTNLIGMSPEPDVMALDIIWPGEFVANGWTLPLNEYFTEEELSEYLPGMMNAVTSNGEVHGIPLYTNAVHLFYRHDLLDKYDLDVPETWSELEAAAQTVLEGEDNADLNGYISMWAQIEGLFMNYLQFLWGAGGSFFNDSGQVTVDTPEARQALQQMVDMVESGVAPESILTYRPNDAMALFRQGRAVFMVVQDFVWPILNEDSSPVAGQVSMGRVPAFEGEIGNPTHAMGGWVLSVNPYSENPDAAAELVRFLTSEESGIRMGVTTGSLPARNGMENNQELLEAYPIAEQLYENFSMGDVRPSAATGARYSEVSNVMQTQVHAALNGLTSVEEALESAQQEIETILAE